MTYKCVFCGEREADRECYFCYDPLCQECASQCRDYKMTICPGCLHVEDGMVYCPDCPEDIEWQEACEEIEIITEMIQDELEELYGEGGYNGER